MSEENEMPTYVVDGTNNSSKALESLGNADFLDHVKSVASSRMERHYLQQYNHQASHQHQQFHENCSSLDSEDSAPGWRLRKIKAAAEARSVHLPPRSLVRGPRFLTYVQGFALPPRPTHHWSSAIFQAGGTPCRGFQFDTLANEAPLDLNFLRAGSSVNEIEKSPISDFVSSDRFFQGEPSRRVIMKGERVGWDVDSGSEHADENEEGGSDNESGEVTGRYEVWTVGLWPQVLHRIQKASLEYLAEPWRSQFMNQHVDHDEFENPLCDLEALGLGTFLKIGTETHVLTRNCRSSKK
ncbi:hypothetical protein BGZ52_001087 [Haplosporangium bisporale]|nr:hypothetical protein BGZ52_001087 [Haplosporangium bisporale]